MASENRPKWRLSTSNLWRPYKPVYQSSVGFWLAERIIEAQNRHKHDNFNGISPKLWKSSQLCLPNSVGFLTRSKSHKNSEIPIPQSQTSRHFSRQNTSFKMTNPPAWKRNQENQPASGFESTFCQAKSQLLGQNAHLWQHLTPVYQTLLAFWLAERMWESPKVRQPTGERQSHENPLASKTQPVGPTEPRVSRIHRLFCHVRGFTCLNQQKKKGGGPSVLGRNTLIKRNERNT